MKSILYFPNESKKGTHTLISGISKRPLKSLVPGGKGSPSAPFPRDHLTLTLNGPSSLHWKTTSWPKILFVMNITTFKKFWLDEQHISDLKYKS